MKRNLLFMCILILTLNLAGCKWPMDEVNSDHIVHEDNSIAEDSKPTEVEVPVNYKPMEVENYEPSEGLESISMTILEGQGIPSIILKDPSEYKKKNPWFNYKDIEVLPVFINKNYNLLYHEGPVEYLTEEEAVEVSLLVAERLGIDTGKYECEDLGASYIIYFPNKQKASFEICPSVDEVRIFFNPLNGNMDLSLPAIDEEDEDLLHEKYLVYYYQLFENILRMKQPVFEASFERNIHGEKMYKYMIFNQEDMVEDTIVNYSTNFARIYIDTNGLSGIDISYKQLMDAAAPNGYENTIIERLAKGNELELLGYYPLINQEEAIEKILNKEYLSTIEYDRDIDLGDIMAIELIYYWVPVNKTIQPVYRVYLDLKETMHDYGQYEEEGLNTYGIFYVPAIETKYLNVG